jgi:antitoxin MazE
MRVNLIKVGNSKGIIIPAAVLAACGLEEAVEMKVEENRIVLQAVHAPRAGWFEGYQASEDEGVLDALPLDEGLDEELGAGSDAWRW